MPKGNSEEHGRGKPTTAGKTPILTAPSVQDSIGFFVFSIVFFIAFSMVLSVCGTPPLPPPLPLVVSSRSSGRGGTGSSAIVLLGIVTTLASSFTADSRIIATSTELQQQIWCV